MNALDPRRHPGIPQVTGFGEPEKAKVGENFDILVPPIDQQAAEVMGHIVRQNDLIAESTGEHNGQPTVSISSPDGRTVYEGSITSEEGVDRLRLGLSIVAAMDGKPLPTPEEPDEVLFGSGRIIPGEVVPPLADQQLPQNQGRARHAREKRRSMWRRRFAAGAVAAAALMSAFFTTDGGTKSEGKQAAPTISETPSKLAPPPIAEPPASVQTPPPTIHHQAIGQNTFEYTQDAQGSITSVTGHLGRGENPWTLTEDAHEIIQQEPSPQAVSRADYYMGLTALKEVAKSLPEGTAMTWKVSISQGEKRLTPVV